LHQEGHAVGAVEVVGIDRLKGNLTGECLLQKTDHGDERQRVEVSFCYELFFFLKIYAANVSRQHLDDFFL